MKKVFSEKNSRKPHINIVSEALCYKYAVSLMP